MGRHVNYADEQDRWLNKAEKLNRNKGKKQRLEDKDPNNLTLVEQLELERRRKKENQRLKEKQTTTLKKEDARISHYRPK
jgi:hypothetical protein